MVDKFQNRLYFLQRSGNSEAAFNETNAQRSSSNTPSNAGDNKVDYSFYVNYPIRNEPMAQHILASVVRNELDAMQVESALRFSLQTPFGPPSPPSPSSEQSTNNVTVKMLNQKPDQVCRGIERKAF